MSLHGKLPRLIERYSPDIAIISECAHPQVLAGKGVTSNANQSAWTGQSQNKGLAVFTFGEYVISQVDHECKLKWILPVRISGPVDLNIVGVWARHVGAKNPALEGPVEEYLRDFQNDQFPTIFTGDFNSSLRFHANGKHRRILDHFSRLRFVSAAHQFFDEEQGYESASTFWRYRKSDSPGYHIDYCFVPEGSTVEIDRVEIGKAEDWLDLSDHVPLVVDLRIPEKLNR